MTEKQIQNYFFNKALSLFIMICILFCNIVCTYAEEKKDMSLKGKSMQIVEQIKNDPKWKAKGKIVTDLGAIIFSLIPPVGVAIDKIGDRLFEPDLNKKIQQLAELIQLLAPEIEKLDDIEAQLGAIFILLEKNQSLLDKLNSICLTLNASLPQNFHVYTDASLQEFIRVTVGNMNVKIEAHNQGANVLYRFKTSGGDVQFYSTTGGQQRIYDSEFEGKSGGKVGMNNLGIKGPIRTFDNEKGTGVGFGPGGKISFGRDGKLSFSGKRQTEEDKKE